MFSPITKRKLNGFFRQRRARIGLLCFILLFFFSMTAELWSNNQPLILRLSSPTETKTYFPLFFYYEPAEFGPTDDLMVDYKKLAEENQNVWALFPPNHWNASEQTDDVLAAPSAQHWFGTDNLGRDVFARLLYGTRISLSFALILWFISYVVGIFLGGLQGYILGIFDFTLERFKELAAIIPMLTIVILVTAITKSQSFFVILSLVLLFAWMGISSQIRANVLSLRKREFCDAVLAMGGSPWRIIFKHILPNALTPVITMSPFAIEGGISLLAVLDYLGFGLAPPTPSIGELLAQGRDNIQNAPWVLTFPILTILLLLISISLIGQALRKAFDPLQS